MGELTMDPDRFGRLDGLLKSALQLSPLEREVYLRELSASDPGLEDELRSLLALERQGGDFLERPAVEAAGYHTESFQAGVRLGPYEVLAPLGVGGMGEVYRARDSRLNREVALKVLPNLFAEDLDRLARFKREAQVLASLNHPNIGGIYGFEEANGIRALVLELVAGPTLADRIAQGRLLLDEALAIARQIADGLDAAHE